MRKFRARKLLKIPLILIAVALFGLFTMLLWNALMPVIFGLPAVTYIQAIGLLILSKLLFGRMGPPRGGFRGKKCGPFGEKWMNMSPEERKQFMSSRGGNFENTATA